MNPRARAMARHCTSPTRPSAQGRGSCAPRESPHATPAPAGAATVSRRSLAKGAAWSLPTIALGVAAPAYAASTDVYGPTICSLFYPAGASASYQGLQVYLGVYSTSTVIPKGTEFAWTVTMSGGSNNEVPTLNYSQNSRWSLGVSPVSGSLAPSFTVHLRVLQDGVTQSELNCNPALIWNDTYTIYPGSRVSIQGTTTISDPSLGQAQSSSLQFNVAKRYPVNVNDTTRKAHKYQSKSGLQTCYPEIKYVMTAASKGTTCGDGANNDTSTIYPDGSCVKIAGTTADQGTQQVIPAKC